MAYSVAEVRRGDAQYWFAAKHGGVDNRIDFSEVFHPTSGPVQRADGQLIELQACRRSALLQDASDASASVLVN